MTTMQEELHKLTQQRGFTHQGSLKEFVQHLQAEVRFGFNIGRDALKAHGFNLLATNEGIAYLASVSQTGQQLNAA